MIQIKILGLLLLVALAAVACGGRSSSTSERGTLLQNSPRRTVSFSAAELGTSLTASNAGRRILALAGTPVCGVDVQYIQYATVGGGANEQATASGALLLPTGSDARCSGARPIVLHAHGTAVNKNYNLAALNDSSNPANTEALLMASFYAAQGFIVVAPNYVGYDSSNLNYHPYLNAEQQSKEMIDALTAAKTALPTVLATGASVGPKLFLTGYSEGGHVAMATLKAMQELGIRVTASAPNSGPYALAAQVDATFLGNVNAGSTIFTPLITTSFQKSYGGMYSTVSDFYESNYAVGIESLMPGSYSFTTLVTAGKLPQLALFNSTPPAAPPGSGLQSILNGLTPPKTGAATDALFANGFGSINLIKNSARLTYLMDAFQNPDGIVPATTTGLPAAHPVHSLRAAAKRNDLRGWTPRSPVMMCGGANDPVVFYSINTGAMKALWAPQVSAGLVDVVDVDSVASSSGPASDPFYVAKADFAQALAQTVAAAGSDPAAQAGAIVENYHGPLVLPACTAAARVYFARF